MGHTPLRESVVQQMAKLAMELLATPDPKNLDMKKKIKEVESSIWYAGHEKNYSKVAAVQREKF